MRAQMPRLVAVTLMLMGWVLTAVRRQSAGVSHLSVDVHHVGCLQPHVEVQAQLAAEAVQGAQRAAGQQHTARDMRQAPAGITCSIARHSNTCVASGNTEKHT
jgi:hypothetical protein